MGSSLSNINPQNANPISVVQNAINDPKAAGTQLRNNYVGYLGGALGGVMGNQLATNVAGGGTGSSALGTQTAASPSLANIQTPFTSGAVGSAQKGANSSLDAQNALLSALQGQQGFSAQTGVLGQQQNFSGQLQNAGGVGAQVGAISQQQALNNALRSGIDYQQSAVGGLGNIAGQQYGTEQQLQGVANGTGPNPAMAALNQQTGQNVANQAALMAGQRGAGANIGLLARQAAQQGAATQQQAVGQGATMQAQQSLNALGQMGAQQQAEAGTQQAIAGIGGQQLGMQQAGIGQQANIGAGLTGAQQAALGQQAAQANTIAGQQIGATTAATQAQLANTQQQQQALAAYNNSLVSGQNSVNAGNAGITQAGMGNQANLSGGLLQGVGSGLMTAFGAEGGEVQKLAFGDAVTAPSVPAATPLAAAETQGQAAAQGPQSQFGKFLNGFLNKDESGKNQSGEGSQNTQGQSQLFQGSKSTGKGVGALIGALAGQAGAGSLAGDVGDAGAALGADAGATAAGAGTEAAAGGGAEVAAEAGAEALASGGLAKAGGHVKAKTPAQKAVKKGDSYANDKVPAMLSEGEIVLPREVTMGKDPTRGAAEFVQKVLAKRKVRA